MYINAIHNPYRRPNTFWTQKNIPKTPQELFGCQENIYIWVKLIINFIEKMVVPLGWYPSCLTPPQEALQKGIYPITTHYKYYKGVLMELVIKGPPSQGAPAIFPMKFSPTFFVAGHVFGIRLPLRKSPQNRSTSVREPPRNRPVVWYLGKLV